MDVKELKKYKIRQEQLLSESDKKHLENYKQLIKFFEIALGNSLKEGKADYNSLHGSCLQCIRFLDNLIYNYESSFQNVKMINDTIDKIISEYSEEENLGNDPDYQSPL